MREKRHEFGVFERVWNSTLGLPQQYILRTMMALKGRRHPLSRNGFLDWSLLPGIGMLSDRHRDVSMEEAFGSGMGSQLAGAILTDPLSYVSGGWTALAKGGFYLSKAARVSSLARPALQKAMKGMKMDEATAFLKGVAEKRGLRDGDDFIPLTRKQANKMGSRARKAEKIAAKNEGVGAQTLESAVAAQMDEVPSINPLGIIPRRWTPRALTPRHKGGVIPLPDQGNWRNFIVKPFRTGAALPFTGPASILDLTSKGLNLVRAKTAADWVARASSVLRFVPEMGKGFIGGGAKWQVSLMASKLFSGQVDSAAGRRKAEYIRDTLGGWSKKTGKSAWLDESEGVAEDSLLEVLNAATGAKHRTIEDALNAPGINLSAMIGLVGSDNPALLALAHPGKDIKKLKEALKFVTPDDIVRLAQDFEGIVSGNRSISPDGLFYAVKREMADPTWKKLVESTEADSAFKVSAHEIGASTRRFWNKIMSGGKSGLKEIDDLERSTRAHSLHMSRDLNAKAQRVGEIYEALAKGLGVESQEISSYFSYYAQVGAVAEDIMQIERIMKGGSANAAHKWVGEFQEYMDRFMGGYGIAKHESEFKFTLQDEVRKAAGHMGLEQVGDTAFFRDNSQLKELDDAVGRLQTLLGNAFDKGGRHSPKAGGLPSTRAGNAANPRDIWHIIEAPFRDAVDKLRAVQDNLTAPIRERLTQAPGGGALYDELLDIHNELSITRRKYSEAMGISGDVGVLNYLPGTLSATATQGITEAIEGRAIHVSPAINKIVSQVRSHHQRVHKRMSRQEIQELYQELNRHDEGGQVIAEIEKVLAEHDPSFLNSEVTDPFIANIVSVSGLTQGDNAGRVIDNVLARGGKAAGATGEDDQSYMLGGELLHVVDSLDSASIERVRRRGRLTDAEMRQFEADRAGLEDARFHEPVAPTAPTTGKLREDIKSMAAQKGINVKFTNVKGEGTHVGLEVSESGSRKATINVDEGQVDRMWDELKQRSVRWEAGKPVVGRYVRGKAQREAIAEFNQVITAKGANKEGILEAVNKIALVLGKGIGTKGGLSKQAALNLWREVSMSASLAIFAEGQIPEFTAFLAKNGGRDKMREFMVLHEYGHALTSPSFGGRASVIADQAQGIDTGIPRFLDQMLDTRALDEEATSNILRRIALGEKGNADLKVAVEANAHAAGWSKAAVGWSPNRPSSKFVRDTVDYPRKIMLIRDSQTGKLLVVPASTLSKDMSMQYAGIGPTPGKAFSRTKMRGETDHILDSHLDEERVAPMFDIRDRERERLLSLGHNPDDAKIQVLFGARDVMESTLVNTETAQKTALGVGAQLDSIHRLFKMGLTTTQAGFHIHNSISAGPMLLANGASLPSVARGLMLTMRLLGRGAPDSWNRKEALVNHLMPGQQMGLKSSLGFFGPKSLAGGAAGAAAGAALSDEEGGGIVSGALTGMGIASKPKMGALGAGLGYALGGLESPMFMGAGAAAGSLLGRRGLTPFRALRRAAAHGEFDSSPIVAGGVEISQKEYWETFLHGGGFNTMVGEGTGGLRSESKKLRALIMDGSAETGKFMEELGEFGQQSELFARLWGYNTGIAMGLTPNQSLEKYVLGTFFDYNDISPTSQTVMKRLNSFWTFGNKILGNTYERYMTDPAKFSAPLHTMLALDKGAKVGGEDVSTDFIYGRPYAHWNELSINLGRLVPATEGLQAIGAFYDMLPVIDDPLSDQPSELPSGVATSLPTRGVERPGATQINVMFNPLSKILSGDLSDGLQEAAEMVAVIQRIHKDVGLSSKDDEEDDRISYGDHVASAFFSAFEAAGGKGMEATKRIDFLDRLLARNEYRFQVSLEEEEDPDVIEGLKFELDNMRKYFAQEKKKLKKHL